MPRCQKRTYRTPSPEQEAARLQAKAAAMQAPEVPMHHWPHPIPQSCPSPADSCQTEQCTALTQVLELLQRQCQLTVDLLEAVNGLAAALLVRTGPGANS